MPISFHSKCITIHPTYTNNFNGIEIIVKSVLVFSHSFVWEDGDQRPLVMAVITHCFIYKIVYTKQYENLLRLKVFIV